MTVARLYSNRQLRRERDGETEKGCQKPALQQKTTDDDDDDDDDDDKYNNNRITGTSYNSLAKKPDQRANLMMRYLQYEQASSIIVTVTQVIPPAMNTNVSIHSGRMLSGMKHSADRL